MILILSGIMLPIMTWIFFLAIMDLKKAKDAGKLPKIAEYFALPVLGVGYLLDFLFNVLSSIFFLELPKELLFTSRVSRHIKEDSWRGRLSHWFCANLLNPFDPGHCGKE